MREPADRGVGGICSFPLRLVSLPDRIIGVTSFDRFRGVAPSLPCRLFSLPERNIAGTLGLGSEGMCIAVAFLVPETETGRALRGVRGT